MASITDLQTRWNTLYKTTLPRLAKAKDSVQPHWPVHLDHCFARIILDNAVGVTKPWTAVLKSPAYKNMSQGQLEDAIELGESIAVGEASLGDLNQRSLELREKTGPKVAKGTKRKATGAVTSGATIKEEHGEDHQDGDQDYKKAGSQPSKKTKQSEAISSYFAKSPQAKKPLPSPPDPQEDKAELRDEAPIATAFATPSITNPLELITSSTLTPFRKQVLTLLCHVPHGRYTTYAALSDHISASSHKTCARAVGNAMRNNPFAPTVPCHRVLAADGRIGGFGGHWGEEGKFAGKKREMLREEGVRFDGAGKVVGAPFRDF